MADVVMPQLGETVTEGTITKWLVQVGDSVQIDQPLFEVSTDKVDSEVPATASGVVTELVVPEGETVAVGTVVARVGEQGAAPAPQPAPTPARPSGDLGLSPVVRHLIEENDLDPTTIQGTGVGGRITRADVLAVLDQRAGQRRSAAPQPAPAPAPQPAPAPAPVSSAPARRAEAPAGYTGSEISPGSRDYVVPFTNIRRRTAEHMINSKAVSAHTLMSIEVDFERVERVRRARGAEFKDEEGFTLTYLPFIARAVVESVRAYPNVNASVMGDSLVVHRDVNLSIAVDLNLEGLIAPVVHGADGKRLTGIAREIHDLATRARTRRLAADDIAGGTFTITNPGPFGTFMTGAIINQPQVVILATDGIARKPVVVVDSDGTESIGIHSIGMLTLNFDHRAIDGAYAAAFLAKLKQVLEGWNWEQEL
ncbi:dihydrolipoamide acetyltransferase family protein [Ferrimicrobium acidiphilum]|uniref:Dihydrolipoamide acetyltransferase component of pyruvate dehydrogenase complex n=1 Tax=Ferrimicrobium acidiphilum TaxID=121039 RepID=A0ABV3Y3I6_9ACTN